MKSKRCLSGFFLLALSMALTAHSVSFAAVPAIDQDEYGAAYIKFPNRNAIEFWIKVIDHDGIWYHPDENNPNQMVLTHEVYVEGPGIIGRLYIGMDTGSSTRCETDPNKFCVGAFSMQIPTELTSISGDYTFTVKDPEGKTATAVDNLTFTTPLPPVNLTSLNPNIFSESIVARFDNVMIKRNGGPWILYDDFANEIDPSKWNAAYPNETRPIRIPAGQMEMMIQNPIGMERCRMQINNDPASVTGLGSDIILVASSSPLPKARIAGTFLSILESDKPVILWSAMRSPFVLHFFPMVCYGNSNIGGVQWPRSPGKHLKNHRQNRASLNLPKTLM